MVEHDATRRGWTFSRISWLPVALVLAVTAIIYFWHLSTAPIYLGGDEAEFGIHAAALASTGRDLYGRFMPLFFRMEDLNAWYQPTLFYLIAIVLKVVPLTEGAIRIPTVVIGVLDVFLVYAVVGRLLPARGYALFAAMALALTPAHFMLSRLAVDFICILPFGLGWLWCLLVALETDRSDIALISGLILGAGVYSHIAAWLMMPMYLMVTWVTIAVSGKRALLALAVSLGFFVSILPLIAWLRFHPDLLNSTLQRYQVYDVRHLSPLQGIKDFLNYNNVQDKVSVYWDTFNPSYLFFSGGSNLALATRRVGVFLLPLSVFLAFGIHELWSNRRSHAGCLLLLVLAVAPLGATLVGDRYAIQREMFLLPSVVMVSTFGVAFLWRRQGAVVRLATLLLLMCLPLQFAFFLRDYFTDYQVRSAYWLDPTNFRGVAEYVIAADTSRPLPAVYMSNVIDDAMPRWRFYLAMHDRQGLLSRSHFFSQQNLDLNAVAPDSLLVVYPNDPQLATLTGDDGCCSIEYRVRHVGGSDSAVILRRRRSTKIEQ